HRTWNPLIFYNARVRVSLRILSRGPGGSSCTSREVRMDMSKLPRMSNTPPPPPEQNEDDAKAKSEGLGSAPRGNFCSACGTQMPAGAKFCNNCGASMMPGGPLDYGRSDP